MVVLLLGVCVVAGALAVRPFAIAAGIVFASTAGFYFVFRSGLNLRAWSSACHASGRAPFC